MIRGSFQLHISLLFLACLGLSVMALRTQAHSGGLDRQGCHTNRKTGDYHCHRGSGARASSPAAPSPAPALPLRDNAPRHNPPRRGSRSPGGAFRNCTEAGAAPVHRGEPGYGAHLDSDGDGIGCEPYRGR